jgi:hypothetical protein
MERNGTHQPLASEKLKIAEGGVKMSSLMKSYTAEILLQQLHSLLISRPGWK